MTPDNLDDGSREVLPMIEKPVDDAVMLAGRLGLNVPDGDREMFGDALARLFDQAALVLALPLPDDDASTEPFTP
nr:hypothetical protein [uncultured Lichenicoccus sp.]